MATPSHPPQERPSGSIETVGEEKAALWLAVRPLPVQPTPTHPPAASLHRLVGRRRAGPACPIQRHLMSRLRTADSAKASRQH